MCPLPCETQVGPTCEMRRCHWNLLLGPGAPSPPTHSPSQSLAGFSQQPRGRPALFCPFHRRESRGLHRSCDSSATQRKSQVVSTCLTKPRCSQSFQRHHPPGSFSQRPPRAGARDSAQDALHPACQETILSQNPPLSAKPPRGRTRTSCHPGSPQPPPALRRRRRNVKTASRAGRTQP